MKKKKCGEKKMRVKVVFHRVNFEWLVTVKLSSKFVVKVSLKNIMQGHGD